MDITLIIPFDEGFPDLNGDISAGIQVYEGKLGLGEMVRLCVKEGEAYSQNAVVEFYNEDGTLDGVQVTFHIDDADPVSVREHWPNGNVRATGYEYDDDMTGSGKLSYITEYNTLKETPNIILTPVPSPGN